MSLVTKKTKIGLKNLDKFAYDIICNWCKTIDFQPIHRNIDYSLIIRFYLWDKVGRAIRIKQGFSLDEEIEYNSEPLPHEIYFSAFKPQGTYKKPLFSREKLIFIPFPGPHSELLLKQLDKFQKYKVIAKHESVYISNKQVIESHEFTRGEQWSLILIDAVFKALEKYNIDLVKKDVELLKVQIQGAVEITQLAFAELKKYKPKALYVHTDNHPPFINYILVAKALGIKTFTYQHGLDCEHYILDDCFADYIAVWSNDRMEKYKINSKFTPKEIRVIGNIYLNSEIKLKKGDNKNKTLLFITRPHKSLKCYSPSRNPQEGIQILRVILEFLEINKDLNLVIKPHPMDNFEKYESLILKKNLKGRVIISEMDILKLFKQVDFVVTEDSTAGAEAMQYNLPCIHAHFAESDPVLPFIEYGAAYDGRNKKKLFDNLQKLLIQDNDGLDLMKKNQNKLVQELIPLGSSAELVKFIVEKL